MFPYSTIGPYCGITKKLVDKDYETIKKFKRILVMQQFKKVL